MQFDTLERGFPLPYFREMTCTIHSVDKEISDARPNGLKDEIAAEMAWRGLTLEPQAVLAPRMALVILDDSGTLRSDVLATIGDQLAWAAAGLLASVVLFVARSRLGSALPRLLLRSPNTWVCGYPIVPQASRCPECGEKYRRRTVPKASSDARHPPDP
ncbi:MAG: hypothetical protein AABZ53_04555 [Planctomycetota bacterium]